jgi:hypothetical protein
MADTTEPTIEERLARLHRLHLATAQAAAAFAVGATTGHADAMNSLRNRSDAATRDEVRELEAAALAAGPAHGDQLLALQTALDRLRKAAFRAVALRLHVAALKDAADAPLSLPKSGYVEQRKWMRQNLDAAEGDARRAIMAALAACGLDETTEA